MPGARPAGKKSQKQGEYYIKDYILYHGPLLLLINVYNTDSVSQHSTIFLNSGHTSGS